MKCNRWFTALVITALPVVHALYADTDSPPASTLPAAPSATQPARACFPTFGISYVAPAGWTAEPCPEPSCIARYFKRDPVTHLLLADITISVDRTSGNAQELMARITLSDPGGAALPQSFQIDQLPTVALRKDKADAVGRPYLMFFTRRQNRQLVIFNARGIREDSPNRELVALCKSVQWSPCESPVDHLDLAADPVPIFGEKGPTVRLPAAFRRDLTQSNENATAFVASDGNTGQTMISLLITRREFPFKGVEETNPAVLVMGTAVAMAGKDRRPHVERLPQPQNGAYSNLFFDSRERSAKDQPGNLHGLGMVVEDKQTMLIRIVVYHLDESALEKCADLLPQVFKTCRFAADPSATMQSHQPPATAPQPGS